MIRNHGRLLGDGPWALVGYVRRIRSDTGVERHEHNPEGAREPLLGLDVRYFEVYRKPRTGGGWDYAHVDFSEGCHSEGGNDPIEWLRAQLAPDPHFPHPYLAAWATPVLTRGVASHLEYVPLVGGTPIEVSRHVPI